MEFNTRVKLAIYQFFAETGAAPGVEDIAQRIGAAPDAVRRAYAELRALRVLFLEHDGETIRMAPPFSGVPTQHVVDTGSHRYYANCAWDALGICAALHTQATVRSECAATLEPLTLPVGPEGPGPSSWVFHSVVPASRWWKNLVFT